MQVTKPASDAKPAAKEEAKSPNVIGLENDLQEILGLKVEIDAKGESGLLTIEYSSLEQLDDLCARLSKAPTKRTKKVQKSTPKARGV